MSTPLTRVREEILDVVPDRRLRYAMLSGLPVADYRAEVTIERLDPGAGIVWRSIFRPTVPLTGWFWRRVLGSVISEVCGRLARAAEQPELVALAEPHSGVARRGPG